MRLRLAEGDMVEGYRLERRVGAGGFGQVFMAIRGSRRYALKFISLERFAAWGRRELAVLVHVRHPNIVRLLGHFEWPEDEPEYLVLLMEYVEGLPLYDWAKEENPTARQVARVMSKLARALDVLHQQGVLHRDFKGENVLVRSQDMEPVLVDFGSAGWAGAPRVTGGVLAPSTLHYRSPESVRFLLRQDRAPGERYRYTVADDLYSMGVALYVLLTDAHPFDGPEDVLLTDIVEYVPKAPHMVNVRVPQSLSELCMHLLDKDPRARLESALELSTKLEVMQQGVEATWDIPLCYGWSHDEATTEDVLAPASGEQQRLLQRWIRRKPRRGKQSPRLSSEVSSVCKLLESECYSLSP